MIKVSILKTREEAILPAYATEQAAGMDISTPYDFTIKPMERMIIWTGISMGLPQGFECQVRPRSGLAIKHGITLINSPGTIDADYRGEVGIPLINLGDQPVSFIKGDRIAQLIIAPVSRVVLIEVDSLDSTERGEKGFGSTGKSPINEN